MLSILRSGVRISMNEWMDKELDGKIILIGIGNEIRNDDIAGLEIIEKLQVP